MGDRKSGLGDKVPELGHSVDNRDKKIIRVYEQNV